MAKLVKLNEATASMRTVVFQLVDAGDGITAETGEAGGQPQISTNKGAFTNTGIGTLTHIGNGRYAADLTQAAVNGAAGDQIESRYKSANTAECPGDSYQVVAFSLTDAIRGTAGTALPGAAAEAAGGLYTRGTGAGQINQPANGMVDANTVRNAGTAIVAASGRQEVNVSHWRGTAAPAEDTAGYPRVTIKDGTGTGEIDTASGKVSIATGGIAAASFAAGAIDAAAIGTGAIDADAIAANAIGASELAADAVTEIQAAVAAGSVASVTGAVGSVTGAVGSVTGSVGSVASGGITSASFAASAINAAAIATDAITAAKIAADAIGASELAADAVTEIQTAIWAAATRLLTAGTNIVLAKGVGVTGFNDLSAAQVNTEVDSGLADYDGPTSAELTAAKDSIEAAIAALNDYAGGDTAGVTTLLDRLSAIRAALLDKLDVTGVVASSAEVTAIQNNTSTRLVVPTAMERPDSGSQDWVIDLYVYDFMGNMEAPDSAPTLTVVNQAGTDRSGNLDSGTMALIGTGHYRAVYNMLAAHAIEQLRLEASIVEGGATRLIGSTALVVDTTAVDFTSDDRTKLADIQTKIGSPAVTIAGDIAALNDLSAAQVNTEVDAGLADAGVTGARMARLDADVSSRLATAGYTAPNNAGIGNIKADTEGILEALEDVPTGEYPSPGAVAEAVFDELLSGHVVVGSAGKTLSDVNEGVASNFANIATVISQQGTDSAAIAGIRVDTEDVQDRLPAALDDGRMVSVAQVVEDKEDYALSSVGLTAVAAAVWDRAKSAVSVVGSVGKYVLDTLAAILTKTATIQSGSLSIVSPVTPSGNADIIAGYDYLESNGRALLFSSGGWPDLTDQAVTMVLLDDEDETPMGIDDDHPDGLEIDVVDAGEATQTVRVQITQNQGEVIGQGVWAFRLKAVSDDDPPIETALWGGLLKVT